MPVRFNVDHQTVIINGVGVAPGESHDFPDEQLVAGLWSETDPRQPVSKRVEEDADDEQDPADESAD